jgi:ferredoxin
MNEEDIYKKLALHLDSLPGGFPATDSGVEMRILRKLFTLEEAQMALHLTFMPKASRTIARRARLDPDETAELLERMAQKGLVFRVKKEGKPPLYGAAQYVIGIWEYQVDNLDSELIRDMNAYASTLLNLKAWQEAPQLRTIPVGRSLKVEHHVFPHEEAEALVRSQEKCLVAPCICRREHTMEAKGCERPEDTCLVFGNGADYYEQRGIGRVIDQDEALGILKKADEAGLVLQPSNAKNVVNICCCCGCCCQVLKNIKRHPTPAKIVSTHFLAVVHTDSCEGCGTCVDRCQMEALQLVDDSPVLDLDRCIGCGLCVSTCPAEAITLERKPGQDPQAVPHNMIESLRKLHKTRVSLNLQRKP